ncbi:hypothetical protein [Ancylomarina sp. 16SWW S1-10-2]|uniref:hypothetical protein n=1 Tax=Ancylomarina sp. 16SWW S1-10-2 TaxID=2499681 RepID=UPI0012ADC1A4|nr:hypothetical protein [Ancylomarina sp. 16SWW S1-10-2]MRT94426.1 hypothetical protein [Ancylomarina sp. 16SWW S1-10-2]
MKVEKDFCNDEVKQLWDSFSAISQEELFQSFNEHINELHSTLKDYAEYYESLNKARVEDKNNFASLTEFNQSTLNLLIKSQKHQLEHDFRTMSLAHISKLDDLDLSKTISKKEKFKPYTLNKNIRLILFIKKLGLNIKFIFKVQQKKFFNIFRRLFKKELLGLDTFQRRKIPYKQMVDYYFGILLPKSLGNSFQSIMQLRSTILLDLWQFDQDFETEIQTQLIENKTDKVVLNSEHKSFGNVIEKQEQRLNEFSTKLKDDIALVILEHFQLLDKALLCVDTPELPRKKFYVNELKAKQSQVYSSIDLENERWNNTHTTLIDDWSLDIEIAQLHFSVLNEYTSLNSKIVKFIDEHLSLNIEKLQEFISASSKNIQENSATTKELALVLKKERANIKNEFIDKILAKTIKKLSGSINQDIEKFNSKTIKLIDNVSDKRSFIKSKNYERGIRQSEINWLSPKELLNFEALPHFEASIKKIQLFIDNNMQKARFKLLALGTVSDFSLESAQIMLQNKKSAIKATVQVAEEGLNRALIHLDEATALMDEIKKEPQEQLRQTITTFNTEIQKLKNVDNILELNLKIVKIKAIERSKKLKKDTIAWILNIIPKAVNFVKEHISGTTGFIAEIKNYLGMHVEKVQISHELPEFICQTELALKKLPFVYQRLYQLTPTDEDRFFVSRQTELESLQKAFFDWKQDRFVTTALISEKGNGATSLLNIFLNKIETDVPIIHQSADKKIYNTKAYLAFFAELFQKDQFETNEEIIVYLNSKTDSLILILESLQHFFLKKVNGFECERMLFELMSRTSKKVFWVGTYTIHSWEYLKKTIDISEQFIREVHLQQFNKENLEEVIFKRNNVSGYKIIFEPSRESRNSKSFQKMNEDEKQVLLSKQFFTELTQMSNGNVSLAQLYWLRSTYSVSDDTINIGFLKEIDVSFVKDLPAEHLFAIHTLLIHDGLNLEDYALALNRPENKCRNILIPMLEKGLLIRPKEKFNINPIIFRQIVSLLKSHNFIN